jgi:hypothetical protein
MKKLFGAAKLAHEKKMRKHHRKGKHHMARRRRSASRRTTIVRAAAPIVRVSAPPVRRYHRVRHAARSFAGGVAGEKGAIVAVAAAIGLGLLEKSGTKIPTIGPLGPAGTAAIGLYIYGRMAHSQTAKTMAVGLGCVAMNRWAATGTIAGDVMGGDVMGQGVVFPE